MFSVFNFLQLLQTVDNSFDIPAFIKYLQLHIQNFWLENFDKLKKIRPKAYFLDVQVVIRIEYKYYI